jgi:hypothetical protein
VPQARGHDLFEFGEGAQCGVLEAGYGPARRGAQADRDGQCLLIVEQQRRQGAAGGQPVSRRALDGVHRIAEFTQPVHVPAHGPGADAEAFRQIAA